MHVEGNKARRFQQGGVMPALATYTPMVMPEGIGMSASSEKSAYKSGSGNGNGDSIGFADIKELLKNMLPSDAKIVMAKANQLMNVINSNDDFLSSMYPNAINNMYMEVRALAEQAHQNYDDAQKVKDSLMSKGSISEYAQDQYGRLFYMTKDGKVKKCDMNDTKDKMLLTYGDLLDYRRKAVNGAYNDDMIASIAQATSTREVMATVDEIVDKIGNQSITSSAYISKRDNQVIQGLEGILNDARNGIYKITDTKTGTPKEQKMFAVNAIMRSIPNNQRNFLKLKAKMSNSTPEEILYEIIASRDKSISKRDITKDTDFDEIDEKERLAKLKSGSGESGGQSMELNPARAILERLGEKRVITLNNGNDNNYGVQAIANVTRFRMDNNEKTGMMSADKMLTDKSANLGSVLDWQNASFAGASMNSADLRQFVVRDNNVSTMYLPYKVEADGSIRPDFELFDRIQEKDRVLRELNVDKVDASNYNEINNELKGRGIDIQLDSDGKPVGDYMQFAAINAMTGRNTFDKLKGSQSGLYEVMEDTDFAKRVAETTGVKAENDNVFGFGWLSPDEVIKSTIFVPVTTNPVTAMTSSGENIKLDKEKIDVGRLKFDESRQNRPAYVRPELDLYDILNE